MDKCLYCGNEIDWKRGWHTNLTTFCSDEHRYNYHNALNKIERKRKSIERALNDLKTMQAEIEGQDINDKIQRIIATYEV